MNLPQLYNYPPAQLQLLYCYYMDTTFSWIDNNKGLAAPFWRFYWNGNDAGWLLFENRKIALGPRKAVLIAPATDFEKACSGSVQHFHMHFHGGHLFDSIESRIFEFEMRSRVCEDIGRIISLLEEGKGATVAFLALSMHVMAWTLSNIPAEVLDQRIQHPRIAPVCRHIEENLAEDLTNEQLAALAGMSTNSFINLFTAECGIPPHRHIVNRRMAKACTLLCFTELSIDTIAETLGFSDRNYFTRVFIKLQGIGPAAYRRRAV